MPFAGYLVALGLEGNGGFNLESEYFNNVCAEVGEDKWTYTKAYIWEHKGNFLNKEHVLAKARHNFATGTMVASDFLWAAEKEGFVYQCISYWGQYRVPYRTWITGYWYMVLGLAAGAWLWRAVRCGDREEIQIFVAALSMFGIMLYVMLGEANNRQLYNHLPWIFTMANLGIWVIIEGLENALAHFSGKFIK